MFRDPSYFRDAPERDRARAADLSVDQGLGRRMRHRGRGVLARDPLSRGGDPRAHDLLRHRHQSRGAQARGGGRLRARPHPRLHAESPSVGGGRLSRSTTLPRTARPSSTARCESRWSSRTTASRPTASSARFSSSRAATCSSTSIASSRSARSGSCAARCAEEDSWAWARRSRSGSPSMRGRSSSWRAASHGTSDVERPTHRRARAVARGGRGHRDIGRGSRGARSTLASPPGGDALPRGRGDRMLPREGPNALIDIFAPQCAVAVREATDKQPVTGGTVWFAPTDYHLLIESSRTFSLSLEGPVNYSRPAIDPLFESAAAAYGSGLVGIVLTGASVDGARGALAVRESGGVSSSKTPRAPILPRCRRRRSRSPVQTRSARSSRSQRCFEPLHAGGHDEEQPHAPGQVSPRRRPRREPRVARSAPAARGFSRSSWPGRGGTRSSSCSPTMWRSPSSTCRCPRWTASSWRS